MTYRVRQTTVGPEKRTKSGSSSTSSNSVRPAKHENNAANVKTSLAIKVLKINLHQRALCACDLN